MRLEGIHHVTCITGDAPGNVDFYTRVLGLRLVKKTVNQDDPTVYHLFYADEEGSPGADITFFEYPGARRGRPGAGMVHTITFRVASEEALDFWDSRLADEGIATRREDDRLRFDDPEGLGLELAVVETSDAPLVARHPEIPAELALQGFDSVRAFSAEPDASRALLEGTLGFAPVGDDAWEARGAVRGGLYAYDPPPASGPGIPGAGTVHHVAWASNIDEQEAWLAAVRGAGAARERRSSTASGSARSTSASRAASSSRSRRSGPGSRSTRTPTTSARRSSCRPPSSTCATGSSRC